jgi:hypothetical protein
MAYCEQVKAPSLLSVFGSPSKQQKNVFVANTNLENKIGAVARTILKL